MTTKTIKTHLTALALAAAAFTTTTMLADNASALGLANQGHGPVVTGRAPIAKPPVTQLPPHRVFPISGGLLPPVQVPPHRVFPVGGLLPPVEPPPHQVFPIPPIPRPPVGTPPIGTNPPVGNPPHGSGGGVVVSCHPGTGCSLTGGDRDGDHDRDHDHDYHDRDHDYGYYRWYRDWNYYPYWNYWSFPSMYSSYGTYPQQDCTYEYKWEPVPGYAPQRALVKVCKPN